MRCLYLRCSVALTILGLALPAIASAEDKYYVLLFASQGDPNIPRWSHSFATFVKASGKGDDVAKWDFDAKTISWLPNSGVVLPKLARERGRNYDLKETLVWARGHHARLYLWGPYETNAEFYELAMKRLANLESGAWSYRLLDASQRHVAVVNCVHAICDLAPGEPLITGSSFGEPASAKVARYFRPWLREPEKTHDWLIERLELKEHNLQRRGG